MAGALCRGAVGHKASPDVKKAALNRRKQLPVKHLTSMTSMNTKKETAIGFLVGIIANTLGVLLYILLFSDLGLVETYQAAVEQGHVGSLLALGAILNLVAFFGFLRLRRDYRARGVLMATVLTALVILYYKIF